MDTEEPVAFDNSEISWSRSLRFWLLLVFDVPAITSSFFVLYCLLSNPASRQALHNHTVIVLIVLALIFQLIDVSWYLDFTRRGIAFSQQPAVCLVWWFVDLGVYSTAAIILAWMSIERHILVFHDRLLSTRAKRLAFHYLPLALLLIYATIYYTLVIFNPPCDNTFVYTIPVCGASPCHLFDPILGMWEMGIHGCLMTLVIASFNIGLLIRVVVKKRRSSQTFQWRKYRKMIVQLLSVSILYLTFSLPIMIMWVARLCGLPVNVGVEEQLVTFFLTYWVMLLLPIVSLTSLPELKKKVRDLLCGKSRNQVDVGSLTRKTQKMTVVQIWCTLNIICT